MKKTALFSAIILFVFCASCKKEEDKKTQDDCSGPTPTYSANVSSIITSNCATSGCHNAGSNSGPGALTNYTEIKNSAASIRSSVANGRMPKNGTLSAADKQSILCWIDAGANNN